MRSIHLQYLDYCSFKHSAQNDANNINCEFPSSFPSFKKTKFDSRKAGIHQKFRRFTTEFYENRISAVNRNSRKMTYQQKCIRCIIDIGSFKI